jgi:hypothetical protein
VTAGEALPAIGSEEAKGGVFKTTVEVSPHDLLRFLAFIGIDADAHKITGRFDDVFLAELTVLRRSVTGSKDARDAAALRGNRHEKDGLVGAPGLGETVFKNGIPGNAGGAEIGFGFAKVFWSGTSSSSGATIGTLTAGRTFSSRGWPDPARFIARRRSGREFLLLSEQRTAQCKEG